MPLSDLKIRKAASREKAYKLSDEGGLFLLVKPNGSKIWQQKYRYQGKERLLSHGAYPVVSLKEARQKRDEARTLLASGGDPAVQKRLDQIEAETRARTTTRSFTYDAAGNVTWDNRSVQPYGYGYNAANRMESFSLAGVVQAEYVYDAQGRQVIRRLTQEQKTIHSIFDIDGNRIAEYEIDDLTGDQTLLREYVWMDDTPVAVVENGAVYFVRTDHIGRPVFATDGTGSVVWTASYLPFGGVHTTSGDPIFLRFPGQWFQSESGLHQNWMRDYDPTTGRYIQADPLGLVDGASVYNYVRSNPMRYADPRGEEISGRNLRSLQTQSRCGCEVPSNIPPEFNYSVNVALAQSKPPSPFCLPWFYEQVRNGGPWDYKQGGSQYEDFGNWHYGATGQEARITPWLLRWAAGYAQTRAGTSSPEFGSPWNPFDVGNGDDPRDQNWIQKGIDFQRCGCEFE